MLVMCATGPMVAALPSALLALVIVAGIEEYEAGPVGPQSGLWQNTHLSNYNLSGLLFCHGQFMTLST